MENKSETAKKYFAQGYNCAQAVLLAFADDLKIDKEFALKLASPFGAGMGGQREVCGAVSAMFIVAGLKRGYSNAKSQEEKKKLYTLIKELSDKFKLENGSILCKELLLLQNKDVCVEDACIEDACIEDACIEDARIEDARIKDACSKDAGINNDLSNEQTKKLYKKKPCAEITAFAAELVQEILL